MLRFAIDTEGPLAALLTPPIPIPPPPPPRETFRSAALLFALLVASAAMTW